MLIQPDITGGEAVKVTWLGQAGLYIEADGLRILIDPYLSDSVGRMNPEKHRRMPAADWMWKLEPDVLSFTHEHLDHYDPDTVEPFLKGDRALTVLAPSSCWQKVRQYGGRHNYVQFDRGTQWTQDGVRFTAVKAVHSDPCAIGVLLQTEGKRLYITGDTLYHPEIFRDLPERVDAVFLPINGVGNNMNMEDAARFAKDCGAKLAVPIHWGMFDDLDPTKFTFEPQIIPQYGGSIQIGESV